jgi:catechol 2,3-dioxygenase-like lactoylglutathione lyase family enzyme
VNFRFDSVFYYVSDLERSVRFYRDVLGFTFVSQDTVARFDVDGLLFEIVPGNDELLSGEGNARFCLLVDDVDQTLRELRAKNVVTNGPHTKSNGVLGSFRDPDGNEICVWEYDGAQARS